eukprot:m.25751 g.25751  ORF g.25751 m.25751 type:complete len:152 (+) comp28939_c0_seq2:372-827(+)
MLRFAGKPGQRTVWNYQNLKRFPRHLKDLICSEYEYRVKGQTNFVDKLAFVFDRLLKVIELLDAQISACNFSTLNDPRASKVLPGKKKRIAASGFAAEDNWGVLMSVHQAVQRALEDTAVVKLGGIDPQPSQDCVNIVKKLQRKSRGTVQQ